MTDALDATLVVEEFAQRMSWKQLLALSLATLLVVSIVAGMSFFNDSTEKPQSSDVFGGEDGWRAFSVVAPIDTGINVYHDHFRTNETYPQWLLDGLGVNKVCDVTLEGSWQERYDADKETCWDTLTASDIVYFPGTKIIGSAPDGDSDILILDDPSDGHGSAVTGAVLDANPNAVIFFVEGFSEQAVQSAANQPLVDVITTSFGAIGSVPAPGIERATESAVIEFGKSTPEQPIIAHLLQYKMQPPDHLGRLELQVTPKKAMTRRKSCRAHIQTYLLIGRRSYQITTMLMGTMKLQAHRSPHHAQQESFHLCWNRFVMSSKMRLQGPLPTHVD